jgi:hypothetical protein
MASKTQKLDDLYLKCNRVIEDYGQRDIVFDRIEDYYFMEGEQDEDEEEDEEIERVRLPHASMIVDLVTDMLAGTDMSITVPARSESQDDKDLADRAEDYLWAVWRQNERRQRSGFMQRLAWYVAMYGCAAARVMPTQKLMQVVDGEKWQTKGPIPIQVFLRNPRYVYPRFGADSILYVVERFKRTVEDIRATYGDALLPEFKDPNQEIDWTEYWSPTSYCYWVNSDPVKRGKLGLGPWAHSYGGLPYAFEFARQTGRTEPEYRNRPMLANMLGVIDRMNTYDTMQATFVSRYIGDVLVVKSDEMARDNALREVSTRTGDAIVLKLDEDVSWLNANKQPIELQIARQQLEGMFEKGTFPASVFGTDPGRAMAGYALQMLNQSGRLKLRPVVDCIERVLESVLANVLMVSEKHLAPLLDGSIPFYDIRDVPSDEGTRKARKRLEFNAKKLEGCWEAQVQLGDLMPSDESTNIVLATRVTAAGPNGRPLLSWETAVEKFNLTHSVSEERDRISRERVMATEQYIALEDAIFSAEAIKELKDRAAELDINVEEVLAQAQATKNPQGAQGGAPSGAITGGVPGVVPVAAQVQPQMQYLPTSVMAPAALGAPVSLPLELQQATQGGVSPEQIMSQLTPDQLAMLAQMAGQNPSAPPGMGGGPGPQIGML